MQDIPFQYADQNKATKQYVDLINASHGNISLLGVHLSRIGEEANELIGVNWLD